ncbi:MAG: DUF3297 family protein [Rubrivivax sp.]|nr:DUF3297 family protein [Rubrivivax sp.]
MSDTQTPPPVPDRLSTDPRSPHYAREVIERDVGIRFNGRERHDVSEYCISEGWVRVPSGKTVDRRGEPLLIKLKGKVEAYYRAAAAPAAAAPPPAPGGPSAPA